MLNALAILLVLGGLGTATGCDTNARFNINKITFDGLSPISVHPAVLKDGKLVRQCGSGPVDGFLMNMALLSTERKVAPNSTADVDKDRSIRPGDIINTLKVDGPKPRDIKLSDTNNVDLKIDCLDPLLSAELKRDTPLSCDGSQPAVQLSSLTYHEVGGARRAGHNLLVLMDMSGSMKGFVNHQQDTTAPDFNPADQNKENSPAKTLFIPPDLKTIASDYNSWRLTMVKELIDNLNKEDRFGIVGFGEGLSGDFMSTPCTVPEAEGKGWDDALDTCFGITNNQYWREGIDNFQNKVKPGRSNLWDAVSQTYDFLKTKGDLQRSNHIMVITDGPDTCATTEAFGNCQSPCSVADHSEVLAKLDADSGNPNAPKIHIHFVQFESPGYPGTDARQVEVACESDAHYQFINANNIPKANNQDFQEAVRKAMYNVRFSLMGHWQAALKVPSFADDGVNGTLPGRLYALSGSATVKSDSNLKDEDAIVTFTGSGDGSWDKRLRLRKTCANDTSCGGDGSSACSVYCSSETQLCPYELDHPSGGAPIPSGQSCTDGSGGICCDGTCLGAGETCASCN
jgi:hypothetical protein